VGGAEKKTRRILAAKGAGFLEKGECIIIGGGKGSKSEPGRRRREPSGSEIVRTKVGEKKVSKSEKRGKEPRRV